MSKPLKDKCVVQDSEKSETGSQLKTGKRLHLKAHTQFKLKPKQNSMLSKPESQSHQQNGSVESGAGMEGRQLLTQ